VKTLWRDLRFGFRLVGKNKGFTAIAVLALALGIGPNTAIFSVLYATLLAPLPYPHPDQLVVVWSKVGGGRNSVSAGDFLDWRNQAKAFQEMSAWTGYTANLAGPEGPEQVPGTQASANFLRLVGVKPMLGRDFLPEEEQAGKDHVVILTHRLWQRRFGARRSIVGTEIRMNGEPYTVVGVLPPGQQDRMPNQLWVPLHLKPEQINHDFHWLLAMGRLKPGVTLQQAQADMDVVTRHIGEVYPKSNKGWGATVEPLQNDFLPPGVKTSLFLLMGGVGFILLIACANLANLLLARGTARHKEVAVRASLGASRFQLFRQLLTESVALSLVGGLAGIGLGWATVRLVMAYMPENTLPSEANVGLNLPVLLFTLGATLLAGVLAGCAPAWQAARQELNETLKQSSRSVSGRPWLRRILVTAEFALALTCLAGAGLAIHSFWNLAEVDLGVRTDHILTFGLPVPDGRLTSVEQSNAFYRQVLERIDAVPGVVRATVSTGMPLQGTYFGMPFNLAGQTVADPSSRPGAGFQMVTPGYFATFGVGLKQGRFFSEQDTDGGLRVAMVNEVFVRRYLKGTDPLRQRLVIEQLIPGVTKLGPGVEWQIVGVFRNVAYGDRPSENFPVIYVPFWQSPWPQASLAVRTGGDPASMTKSVAAAVHSIDPDLPLADLKTMDQIVTEARAGDRFGTVMFGGFAAVALLLAGLGIYGVMAFMVEQRTHEIGLRMALGAGRNQVLGLVLGEGMALAAAGLVFGLLGAWLVGRAMQSLLYGIPALDYRAFSAVAAVLLASAFAACYVPALRATWVDPMAALREE
jgi:putative ABC transport system permease protein